MENTCHSYLYSLLTSQHTLTLLQRDDPRREFLLQMHSGQRIHHYLWE